MKELKTPLAKFRAGKKMSLETLGKALGGVDKTTILRWEDGIIDIPIERLKHVQRVTGISPALLRPDVAEIFARPQKTS